MFEEQSRGYWTAMDVIQTSMSGPCLALRGRSLNLLVRLDLTDNTFFHQHSSTYRSSRLSSTSLSYTLDLSYYVFSFFDHRVAGAIRKRQIYSSTLGVLLTAANLVYRWHHMDLEMLSLEAGIGGLEPCSRLVLAAVPKFLISIRRGPLS